MGKMYQVRAAGMAQLGQQLGEMAQRLHEQRSAAEMVSAKAAADAMLTDFMAELQKNPQDFQNYESRFLEKQKEVLDAVSATFTSNDAYRKFTQEFWPLYVENQRARVIQLSLQKEADYTAGKMIENIEAAVRGRRFPASSTRLLALPNNQGYFRRRHWQVQDIWGGRDKDQCGHAVYTGSAGSWQDTKARGLGASRRDKSMLTEKDIYHAKSCQKRA